MFLTLPLVFKEGGAISIIDARAFVIYVSENLRQRKYLTWTLNTTIKLSLTVPQAISDHIYHFKY